MTFSDAHGGAFQSDTNSAVPKLDVTDPRESVQFSKNKDSFLFVSVPIAEALGNSAILENSI